MTKEDMEAAISYTVSPITNVMVIGGSVLPKRFVEGSEFQDGSIMGGGLSSTSAPIYNPITIVFPTKISA